MYDQPRLNQIFSDLERYFSDLDSFGVSSVADLRDKKTFYAVSMVLFSILNHAIDLGQEIVASKKLGVPGTYRDIFKLLETARLIDPKLAKEMSQLVGYRNLLAHEYSEFDEGDLFRIIASADSVRLFSEKMKQISSKKQP